MFLCAHPAKPALERINLIRTTPRLRSENSRLGFFIQQRRGRILIVGIRGDFAVEGCEFCGKIGLAGE
jgi:hypothetical protein